MPSWTFSMDEKGWYWICTDARSINTSIDRFDSFDDCVADATKHGYDEPDQGCHAAADGAETKPREN